MHPKTSIRPGDEAHVTHGFSPGRNVQGGLGVVKKLRYDARSRAQSAKRTKLASTLILYISAISHSNCLKLTTSKSP